MFLEVLHFLSRCHYVNGLIGTQPHSVVVNAAQLSAFELVVYLPFDAFELWLLWRIVNL